MKQLKTLCLTALASILFIVCMFFGSCAPKIEGTYKFKSLSYQQNGMTINLDVGEEFMGMLTLSEDFMVITLNEDGSVQMSSAYENMKTSGTWVKKDDSNIEITINGVSTTLACDGKTITVTEEDGSFVLEKK